MFTLDIEDTCIRMMVVKGKRVETAASLPLEPGLLRDGVIIDTATVSQRIMELMAAHGITERNVVTSISGIHSIYRVVNLPQLPKNLLDEAARREMERVMPMPLPELYTSWQAVNVSDIETVICLVGSPRNTVDAMLETLQQAGLESKVMDIRPLALARVTDEKDAIIINVGPTSFDIIITIDGFPELLRSLPFPADTTSASDKIAEVKEELDRTVAFYNSSHKGNPITQHIATFVSGELGGMLAATLGYRVKSLPDLLSYTDDLNVSEYATNIGLALKQTRTDTSRVNINITPEVYLPKPLPIIQIVSWAFIVAAIAILVPLAISTQGAMSKTSALQAQVKATQAQVQARQGTLPAIEKLQTQINDAKSTRDAFKQPLDSSKAQRARANGDLSKVTSLLPGIIKLQSISYSQTTTGQSLTLSGTAPAETTIVNYVRALRDSGQFSEVLISDMKEVEYNKWEFTLTLK